jgi:DNA-binding response OmpR family regulator
VVSRRRHILLVDEDPQEAEPLRRLLAFGGYGVTYERDLRRAPLVTRVMPQLDLTILCVGIPDSSLLEATSALRLAIGDCPLLAFCPSEEVDAMLAMLEAGCDAYLARPATVTEVLALVREILDPPVGGMPMAGPAPELRRFQGGRLWRRLADRARQRPPGQGGPTMSTPSTLTSITVAAAV